MSASGQLHRLTGGTFIVLLEQARRSRQKARDSLAGKSDGLNNQDLLKALMRIVDEGYPEPPASTFAQNCSAFRACQLSHSTYVPLDDADIIKRFDRRVRSDYGSALDEVSVLVDRFIAPGDKRLLLARRLLGVLASDETIPNDQKFFARVSGTPVSKHELLNASQVCLDALLLGLWHYVVTRVPDNSQGRETFEYWHKRPEQVGLRWRLLEDRIPLHTRVFDLTPPVAKNDPDSGTQPGESVSDETDRTDPEIVDAEIVDDDDQPESGTEPDESRLIENTRVTVFQGGTNNTNIGHVDTLNLGRWS